MPSLRTLTGRLIAGALTTTASLALAACGSSQTNNLAPPPRPPDPAQLTLAPIRVTRAAWAQTNPSAPTPPPPTGRGRRPPAVPSMSMEMATPILVSANEPVRACYKGLLAFSPQASGTITTLMRVAPDGSVGDVEPIGDPDPSLLIMMPCVLNAVRTRRFPPARASSLLSFPFTLRSGEVGAPGTGPGTPTVMPHARPGEIQVLNPDTISVRPWRPTLVPNTNPVRTLTRDMAAEAAPDITSLVDTCYSAALVMVPGLSGQFGLRLAIEPSGNVSRVEVNDQQAALQGPLRECIVALGARLKFHSSGGGAVVSVDVSLAQTDAPAGGAALPGATLPVTSGALPAATIGTPSGGLMPVPTGR